VKNAKLILSAAIAVSAIVGVGAASAADLPMKAMPYTAAAPAFTWTGCYVGAHAGAGVVHDQGFFFQNVSIQELSTSPADRHGVGGLAGGQIGCNYQTGMLVLGIEGEGFWSGMRINQDGFIRNILIESTTIRNKWDYDVAARIGVAFDRALVYGKAGWVAGRFDWNSRQDLCKFISCPITNEGGATLDGLLIGLGLEYAFTNNWTVKFEYDYLGFGAKNVGFTANCPTPTCSPSISSTFTENVSADKHIFKVGLNYLFNWGKGPVVARY
jgi:outer membrane immunogenic protein